MYMGYPVKDKIIYPHLRRWTASGDHAIYYWIRLSNTSTEPLFLHRQNVQAHRMYTRKYYSVVPHRQSYIQSTCERMENRWCKIYPPTLQKLRIYWFDLFRFHRMENFKITGPAVVDPPATAGSKAFSVAMWTVERWFWYIIKEVQTNLTASIYCQHATQFNSGISRQYKSISTHTTALPKHYNTLVQRGYRFESIQL